MRIINRTEFLALEGPVLYSKFTPMSFGEFFIKLGNAGNNDWVCDQISADAILNSSTEEWMDLLDRAQLDQNINLNMDFEYSGRDGLYEGPEVQFAIFDKEDVLQLVQRLLEVVPGYSLVHAANTPIPKKPLAVRLREEYGEVSATTFPGFLEAGAPPPSDDVHISDLVRAGLWRHIPDVAAGVLQTRLNPDYEKLVSDSAYHMLFGAPIKFFVSKDTLTFKHEGGDKLEFDIALPYDLLYILYAPQILESILDAGKDFPYPVKPFLMWNHPALHSVEVAEAVMKLMPEILRQHPSVKVFSNDAYAEVQRWKAQHAN